MNRFSIFAPLALLATPAAASDCVPLAEAQQNAKEAGLSLTFEGFVDGGSLQVYTDRSGEWLMIVATNDGRACPIVAGDAHNITLGSLI